MPIATHIDRDDTPNRPADEAFPPRREAADDTATHDLAELWRDIGGCD